MTSSTSCSSRALGAAAAALVLAVASGGCAARQKVPAPAAGWAAAGVMHRVALFPIENLASAPIPARSLVTQIERALASAGLEVVGGELVSRFLERHRLRYTGGIDGPSAAAARDELGVDGIVLTTVELYGGLPQPRLSMTMRLVSASEEAAVVWIDGAGRTGNDAPGLLGLGLVSDSRRLEAREVRRVVASLAAFLEGKGPSAPPCPDERRFRPKISFRSRLFDPARSYSIAVLPFVNQTDRRSAGEIVALEFARQLATDPRLRVVEPGVVRDRLLQYRIIMEGGVSIDAARTVLEILRADLVVAGYVREYRDSSGGGEEPTLSYTVLILERDHGTVVWESTSNNSGNDGVFFFDLGHISTANALTCRMARDAVIGLLGKK